jgi:hypothetical protein
MERTLNDGFIILTMPLDLKPLHDAVERAVQTMEAAKDQIETQKKAATLNARVAEASSTSTMAAARLVTEALDRNTASSTRTGTIMIWLTAAYVLLTLGLLLSAWLA